MKDKDLIEKDTYRHILNIYYIVDTSEAMHGECMDFINNQLMPELVNIIAEQYDLYEDEVNVRENALCFSSGSEWMYNTPLTSSDFKWIPRRAGGLSDLGHACESLDKCLRDVADFYSTQVGQYPPVVILISHGEPTDDFEKGYRKLSENKWFRSAMKIAIPVGTGVDNKVLCKFVGELAASEAVILPSDAFCIKSLVPPIICD